MDRRGRATEAPTHGSFLWIVRTTAWMVSVPLCLCGLFVAGCASKAPPVAAVAAAPRHPDFLFPQAPDGTPAAVLNRLDAGWQYLQRDDLRGAEREFAAALKGRPSFYPAEAGLGYAALAGKNATGAAEHFASALRANAVYVPALAGRGQAFLELGRDEEALGSFEAALKADPSLVDLGSRIEVLRFRAMQVRLARATAAAAAGRLDEAKAVYEEAIAGSPDSAFLYRELASVEQQGGETRSALEHYRKAADLDPGDAHSLAAIGAILETQGDVVGALSAYERARAVDPAEVAPDTLARIRGQAALARLPAQYRAIASSTAVTKADVAALVAVRLAGLVAGVRPRQVVITDIRGHWAQTWITAVVRAGVMDTLPNYQFQPAERVRRGDMAQTVSRLLSLVAERRPEAAKAWMGARLRISDLAAEHLSYSAVSVAVASGVMPLAKGAFDLLRQVTGAEALEIVGRVEALAGQP